jgi:dihydropteroate synthase
MVEKQKQIWSCRGRQIDCSGHTLIMGILNVTPDSFSDGGTFASSAHAVNRALQMVGEGGHH